MKLEIGKRYKTRDGLVTDPMEYDSSFQSWLARLPDGPSHAGSCVRVFNSDGTHKYDIRYLDLVEEYVEDIEIVFKSSDFHKAGSEMFDHIMSGKRAGWSSATLSNIKPIEHVIELVVPDGWLPHAGEVRELALHETHADIQWWDVVTRQWVAGLPRYDKDKLYAVRSGSALAVKCKLEPLKLEAGRRYVLTDGRVTTELLNASKHPFCVGVDGKAHYVYADGSVWYKADMCIGRISHPAE